jgi:hypothetical protein
MKGQLIKTEKGWVVSYHYSVNKNDWETLPLHPDFIEMMDTCFTSKFTYEVDFEIVTEWETGEVGVNGLTYAKLLHHSVDTNEMINHIGEVNEMVNHVPDIGKMVEISDEEIEKWVTSTPYYGYCTTEYREGLEEGAKWYREQLKNKP